MSWNTAKFRVEAFNFINCVNFCNNLFTIRWNFFYLNLIILIAWYPFKGKCCCLQICEQTKGTIVFYFRNKYYLQKQTIKVNNSWKYSTRFVTLFKHTVHRFRDIWRENINERKYKKELSSCYKLKFYQCNLMV